MASAVSVFGSAARTASENSPDLNNNNSQNVHLLINVSAITATPSVVFTIQGKEPIGGLYYDLLASPAITATGTTVLKVGPGLEPVANGAAADFLPVNWRVKAVHGDADSITYSVVAVFGE